MRNPAAIFLCDRTGIMAEPWAEAGYTCICVDLQHPIRATKAKRHPVKHYPSGGCIHFVYGDARSWKPSMFDKGFFTRHELLFVACFPVCTNIAVSGAQDWEQKGLAMLSDGLLLFNACEQVADWSGAAYCIENPVGALSTHHRKPDFYFHPWFWGDLYTKKTCLWTGNGFVMPKADYITAPEGTEQKIWLESPSDERADIRSATPAGFAKSVFNVNNKLFTMSEIAV